MVDGLWAMVFGQRLSTNPYRLTTNDEGAFSWWALQLLFCYLLSA